MMDNKSCPQTPPLKTTCKNPFQQYEEEKACIAASDLDAAQYEEAVKQLAARLNI